MPINFPDYFSCVVTDPVNAELGDTISYWFVKYQNDVGDGRVGYEHWYENQYYFGIDGVLEYEYQNECGLTVGSSTIWQTNYGYYGSVVGNQYTIDVGTTLMLGGILAFLIAYWFIGLVRNRTWNT